jgi:hypothetical protein
MQSAAMPYRETDHLAAHVRYRGEPLRWENDFKLIGRRSRINSANPAILGYGL